MNRELGRQRNIDNREVARLKRQFPHRFIESAELTGVPVGWTPLLQALAQRSDTRPVVLAREANGQLEVRLAPGHLKSDDPIIEASRQTCQICGAPGYVREFELNHKAVSCDHCAVYFGSGVAG